MGVVVAVAVAAARRTGRIGRDAMGWVRHRKHSFLNTPTAREHRDGGVSAVAAPWGQTVFPGDPPAGVAWHHCLAEATGSYERDRLGRGEDAGGPVGALGVLGLLDVSPTRASPLPVAPSLSALSASDQTPGLEDSLDSLDAKSPGGARSLSEPDRLDGEMNESRRD